MGHTQYTQTIKDELDHGHTFIDTLCDQLELALYSIRQEAHYSSKLEIIKDCDPKARIGRLSALQAIEYNNRQREYHKEVVCTAIRPLDSANMRWIESNAVQGIIQLRESMLNLFVDFTGTPSLPGANTNREQEELRVEQIINSIASGMPELNHPHYQSNILCVELALQRTCLFDKELTPHYQADALLGWRVLRKFIPKDGLFHVIADDIRNTYGSLRVSFRTVVDHWRERSPALTLRDLAEDANHNNCTILCELWLAPRNRDTSFHEYLEKVLDLILTNPSQITDWDTVNNVDICDLTRNQLRAVLRCD